MEEEIIYIPKEKIIKVGETFRVDFVSMTHDGMGICKLNGKNKFGEQLENFPIFVKNAITNEAGIIEITSLKRSFGTGKLVKIFKDKTSPHRCTPICPIYESCGGCHIMHLTYPGQLAFKTVIVKQTLEKIGGLKDIKVMPTLASVDNLKYRNKVQIPFGTVKNKTVCGFYKNQSHEIIPLEECYIQSDEMTEIVKFIRNLCNEFHIKGYDETTKAGELRHALVRESKQNNEVMVVLVTTKKELPVLKELAQKLVKRHPSVVSVIQNINSEETNVVLGKKNILIYGKETITDTLLGHSFVISPNSFYQVNPKTTALLYQKAIQAAKLQKTDNVIDAYCGIGTIGISLAEKVNHVYGVEVVKEAIENAKYNAKLNNLENIDFVCAKAEEQIVEWKKSGLKIDAIFVDPPRKGLDLVMIKTIAEMDIKKVVYISCDIATMARDIKNFVELGYTVNKAQPVDMFPQTLHVETVICLDRK